MATTSFPLWEIDGGDKSVSVFGSYSGSDGNEFVMTRLT